MVFSKSQLTSAIHRDKSMGCTSPFGWPMLAHVGPYVEKYYTSNLSKVKSYLGHAMIC